MTNDQIYIHSKNNNISGKNNNSFFLTIPFFTNNKEFKDLTWYGSSLPILALQYSNIELNFEFEKMEKIVKYGMVKKNNCNFECKIVGNCIYLSSWEKNKFISVEHEYLSSLNDIFYDKLTKNNNEYSLDLNKFKLCVRNFSFAFRNKTSNIYFNYLPICECIKMYICGEIIKNKFGECLMGECLIDEHNIYTYHFELVKNEFKPSGSLNFSENFGNIYFTLKQKNDDCVFVFSTEYFNILKISNGFCSVIYKK